MTGRAQRQILGPPNAQLDLIGQGHERGHGVLRWVTASRACCRPDSPYIKSPLSSEIRTPGNCSFRAALDVLLACHEICLTGVRCNLSHMSQVSKRANQEVRHRQTSFLHLPRTWPVSELDPQRLIRAHRPRLRRRRRAWARCDRRHPRHSLRRSTPALMTYAAMCSISACCEDHCCSGDQAVAMCRSGADLVGDRGKGGACHRPARPTPIDMRLV